jgi:hypothetical protein
VGDTLVVGLASAGELEVTAFVLATSVEALFWSIKFSAVTR